MKLELTKALCFFDLETTGTAISKDRIVEMAVLKLHPDGTKETKQWRVNPEQPIPEEASSVHGITDEMVAGEPTFKELSKEIYSFIQGCDLAGYNSDRFDIPLLVEELLRAEIPFDFKNIKTVDVQTIFHKMEARTLAAALKFYCSKELTDAHTAQAEAVQINALKDIHTKNILETLRCFSVILFCENYENNYQPQLTTTKQQ